MLLFALSLCLDKLPLQCYCDFTTLPDRMSDYHPCCGQLFWPLSPVPFTVCLGLSSHGDDITPQSMRGFSVPAGKGVYIHPGTWHSGMFVSPQYAPITFLTRQGRVHSRVSCSWAAEFSSLLRVRLNVNGTGWQGGGQNSRALSHLAHYRKTTARLTAHLPYFLDTCTDVVFMVRPTNFRLNEQTVVNNHFQKNLLELSRSDITAAAQREFDVLVGLLRAAGISVISVSDNSTHDTPDAVFPNNWVSFHATGEIILYPMFAPNRRLERRADLISIMRQQLPEQQRGGKEQQQQWMKGECEQPSLNLQVQRIVDYTHHEAEGRFLEGTGSMVLDRVHRIAYCALSSRADESLFRQWCTDTGYRPCCFVATSGGGPPAAGQRRPIYHTNVMMALGTTFAVICLEVITDPTERACVCQCLQNSGKQLIEISEEQMHHFAGNMLQLRSRTAAASAAGADIGTEYAYHLVMSSAAYTSLTKQQVECIEQTHECNIIHCALPVIETCGGGSARCMLAEVFLPKGVPPSLLK